MHMRCQRIGQGTRLEIGGVFRASVLGEVVDVQQQPLTGRGKMLDESRERRTFAERVIVKMPDVRQRSERRAGGGTEII